MSPLARNAARGLALSVALILALAGPAGAKVFEEGEEAPEGEMVITVDDEAEATDPDQPVSSGDEPMSYGDGPADSGPVADPDEDGTFEPAEPAPVLEDDGVVTVQPAAEASTGGDTLPFTGPSTALILLAVAGMAAVGGGATLVAASNRRTR